MSKRTEHLFQFTGKQISAAAQAEYDYHMARIVFWREEGRKAVLAAKEKGVEVREYPVSGGMRTEMVIDTTLQGRINESAQKVYSHQSSADHFQIEAATYGSQPDRAYELHGDDVIYFRLAGGARPE